MPMERAMYVLNQWCDQGLKNVRFSGGEPMVYPGLRKLVQIAKRRGVEHIAISTNGSFPLSQYLHLICLGVNDFSISLDACCAADGGVMGGTTETVWERVVENIRAMARETYVTVGVVLTEANVAGLVDIVTFAHNLGVADIRIISAAQYNKVLEQAKQIPQEILDAHPILKYRVENILQGRNVRGIDDYDSKRCYLAVDDSVVSGEYHFACVIHMREKAEPIGKVGPYMREERLAWAKQHNTHLDPICRANCLDVCIDHNNYCASLEGECHCDSLTCKGCVHGQS